MDCCGEMGRSVSSPESDSSSSQESATACCFFLKADDDFEGCGSIDSLARDDSSSAIWSQREDVTGERRVHDEPWGAADMLKQMKESCSGC